MTADAQEKTVKVDLKRTYGKGTTYYGPGKDIEMPERLALALGVHPSQQKASVPKAAAKSTTKKETK